MVALRSFWRPFVSSKDDGTDAHVKASADSAASAESTPTAALEESEYPTNSDSRFEPSGSIDIKPRTSVNFIDSLALRYPLGLRRRLWYLLDVQHGRFDNSMCGVILANVGLMVVETQMNASCAAEENTSNCRTDSIMVLNQIFLLIYSVECAIRYYVYRCKFWKSYWNVLDFFVVFLGYLDLLFILLGISNLPGPSINVLRIFRLFRLLRAVKMFRNIKELHSMLRGFASALRSMFWGFVMISVLLLFFAILCVELVNPISIRVHEENTYCREAFGHIWFCMIMFFQGLVAGDSWGECTIPLIKHTPWTVIIFILALVCIQLGFMNLILAVIVERAYEARAHDEEELRRDREEKEIRATKRLRKLFEAIDTDKSGSISLEELLDGYDFNDDMKNMFAIMDLNRDDLEVLFGLMDVDDTNDISYQDLIDNLRTAIASDRKNLAMIRLQVAEVGRAVKKITSRRANMTSMSLGTPPTPTRGVTCNSSHAPVDQHAPSDINSVTSAVERERDAGKLRVALENLNVEPGCRGQSVLKPSATMQAHAIEASPSLRRSLNTAQEFHTLHEVFSREFTALRHSIQGLKPGSRGESVLGPSAVPSSVEASPDRRSNRVNFSRSFNAARELNTLREIVSQEFTELHRSIRVVVDSMGNAHPNLHKEFIFELGTDVTVKKATAHARCDNIGDATTKER